MSETFETGAAVLVNLPAELGGPMFGVVVDSAEHPTDENGDPIDPAEVPVRHENGLGVWGCKPSWLG